MKFAACVVVASIFVNTVKALESKQVNLALETVLNFDKKDRASDLAVIDKVQNFLEHIKNGMKKGSSRRNTKHEISLTDFILEAAKILRRYDDTDLEDAYVIINDESRKYINMESEFQDLYHIHDIRRYVSDQLNEAKDMPAYVLRRNLDSVIDFIETHKKTGVKSDLLDIGNTLYDGASDKFLKALRDLNKLRRASEINLERVLRDTLKSLVFDHYYSLNNHVRDELVNMVKHYWRAFADKQDSKHIRLKTVDVTPFPHKNIYKRHRHKSNSPSGETHSSKPKPYKTHQNDKTYKSNEKYVKGKHEVFLTDQELKKLINNEEALEEKPKNRFSVFADKNKPRNNFGAKKLLRNKHELGRGKPSPHLEKQNSGRLIDRREKQHELTESSEPGILMGGQIIRDMHFRADESVSDLSEDFDRAERDSSTEEIVIQHSNIVDIGLSRKTPGRINITFVSSEINKTDDSQESASMSMSIENNVMRKSNVNDTLETNSNPRAISNVNTLIKNIERQIENVKDQVEYVKNLTRNNSDDKEPASTDHNEPENLTESTKNLTGAETTKTDSGFAFRAKDSDIDNSPEENDSIKGVTESTTITTEATHATEYKITDIENTSETVNINKITNPDKTKEQEANDKSETYDAENTSETVNINNITNPDKTKEQEANDKSETYDANKAYYVKEVTDTTHFDMLNEKEDGHKEDDKENAITESNFNSSASMLVDVKIEA